MRRAVIFTLVLCLVVGVLCVLVFHGRIYRIDWFQKACCVSWKPVLPYQPAWAGQINRWGFRYTRWSDGEAEIRIPEWSFWVVGFIAAALSVGILMRQQKKRRGNGLFCQTCGYDLRATPCRCPECGTVAEFVAKKGA